jgi:hypothetical protein
MDVSTLIDEALISLDDQSPHWPCEPSKDGIPEILATGAKEAS